MSAESTAQAETALSQLGYTQSALDRLGADLYDVVQALDDADARRADEGLSAALKLANMATVHLAAAERYASLDGWEVDVYSGLVAAMRGVETLRFALLALPEQLPNKAELADDVDALVPVVRRVRHVVRGVVIAHLGDVEGAHGALAPAVAQDSVTLSTAAAFLRGVHNHYGDAVGEENREGLRYWAGKLQSLSQATPVAPVAEADVRRLLQGLDDELTNATQTCPTQHHTHEECVEDPTALDTALESTRAALTLAVKHLKSLREALHVQ